MNDMTLFLDLILIASGAYCMYTFLRLAVTKRLFKNGLLVPKEKKISDCADEQMYIGYMMPPLAVMAVMTMGYGVCMLLNDLRETPFLPYPWPLVILGAVLASAFRIFGGQGSRPLLVFFTCLKTSSKRFSASSMISGVSAMEVYRRLPASVTMPFAI